MPKPSVLRELPGGSLPLVELIVSMQTFPSSGRFQRAENGLITIADVI